MNTDQKLLMIATGGVALAALNLLRVCACILFEHYTSLHSGKQNKRAGRITPQSKIVTVVE